MTETPSLDARIVHIGRVAGVDRSRIFNEWFECQIEVRPSVGRPVGYGYAWKAVFDRSGEKQTFDGEGGTRTLAMRDAVDVITKHIYTVAEQTRIAKFGTPAMQPEALQSWPLWRRLVESVRRFFVRALARRRS